MMKKPRTLDGPVPHVRRRWRRCRVPVVLAACCALVTSFGAARASSTPPPSWHPTLEGRWETETGGPSVYYACYGEGSPAIVLEAGTDTGGSQAYSRRFLEPLAERTMTCIYDRLGTGASDAPSESARTVDDTRVVLEGLLDFIDLTAPYLLVGQSGGGNFHIDFAAHHPEKVAGLVLIESYHDDPDDMAAWQAEEGFEWTDNPERVDWLDGSVRLDEIPLPIGDFPVLVLTATHADEGNVENQAYWLGISPHSQQVVIEGGHDLHWDDPDALTALILDLLDASPSATEGIRGCVPGCVDGFVAPGPLPAGEFTTTYFLDGHLTLMFEPGWASAEDQGVEFNAAPEGEADSNRVLFWTDLVPVEPDGNVAEGVPNTAEGFLGWLARRPGVQLSDRAEATIGHAQTPAMVVDMAVADDAENEEPGCPFGACILPFTWVNAGPNVYGTTQPWVLRMYVSDVTYGGAQHTITVAIEAQDRATLEAFLPAAERLIASAVAPLEPAAPAEPTIVGSWHRVQTCDEMLALFEAAGLAESHRGWLQGNFFGGADRPSEGDACEGARGPLEHDHCFTDAGEFGSHDEHGQQVDNGDYVKIDADTLAFPSHAAEFGYDGELTVDYEISGDNVTFDVALPDACDHACKDAYAWALSAFASGPWTRGEVPS